MILEIVLEGVPAWLEGSDDVVVDASWCPREASPAGRLALVEAVVADARADMLRDRRKRDHADRHAEFVRDQRRGDTFAKLATNATRHLPASAWPIGVRVESCLPESAGPWRAP